MDEIKEEIELAYSEFPGWKEDSDKFFGPKQAIHVWRSIDKFLPAPEKDLVVLGATENIPTHLTAIWNVAIKERTGKVNFLVGDIGVFPVESLLNAEVKPNLTDRCKFDVFQWDAENLPVKPGSVDVIFDRAGWLWHCIKDYKDEERLMNSLINYYNLLKDGGIVVIDAIEGFNDYLDSMPKAARDEFERKINSGKYFRPSELFRKPPGQYQHSTIDMMTEGTGDNFWFYVGRFFEIEDVGEDVERVRVLKKKVKG